MDIFTVEFNDNSLSTRPWMWIKLKHLTHSYNSMYMFIIFMPSVYFFFFCHLVQVPFITVSFPHFSASHLLLFCVYPFVVGRILCPSFIQGGPQKAKRLISHLFFKFLSVE